MKDNKEIIISGSVEQQSLIKDLRQIIEQGYCQLRVDHDVLAYR